jgi:hypothetical protein
MTKRNALLDTLIPGDGRYPPASQAGVETWLTDRAARFGDALGAIEAALPDDFAEQTADRRETLLRAVEQAAADAFSLLLTGVYSAYYSAAPVLGVIEAETGYAARPPQPEGHALDPFDPACVAVPAARPPSWRPTP